ncbi:MAG: NAD-dependent epimerase/dehydratase family protein [Synergistaceae bacterium]|jgi:UDP-glucose 4-epimerase|nr:NAD-dependent epimerase/dehydratase family protein [Synergistaceae bacterium]
MKRVVFVTGAGGFIGSSAARHYALTGDCVVGLGHRTNPCFAEEPPYLFEETSIHLEVLEHLAKKHGLPAVIVHCAGSSSVAFSIERPREDFKKNVDSLLDVLEFSRKHDSSIKIIYLSSAAVYGTVENNIPIEETAPVRPISPYGLHKCLSESLCAFHARYWHIPLAVVRLFSVYGNGLRKQLLWDACNKLRQGRYFFEGTGKEERDWLHISDVVKLLRMAESHATEDCPVVNGGTGAGHSVEDVLKRLGELWNPVTAPVFSGTIRRGDPFYLVPDTARIKEWGFAPEMSLTEGLLSYLNWYKSTEDTQNRGSQ